VTIGRRLKEERNRLGFTQPALAAVGETTKKTQIDYENDATQPKAGYLAAIAKLGADVQYIITGQRSAAALSVDEEELISRFRAAPLPVKAAAIGALQGAAGAIGMSAIHVGRSVNINAPVGVAAGGDVVIKTHSKLGHQ